MTKRQVSQNNYGKIITPHTEDSVQMTNIKGKLEGQKKEKDRHTG